MIPNRTWVGGPFDGGGHKILLYHLPKFSKIFPRILHQKIKYESTRIK